MDTHDADAFARTFFLSIVGLLILMGTFAFVVIPYTLDRYPLTVAELGAKNPNYHLS